MENRGSEPTITSSAFHWGTNRPFTHDYRTVVQQQLVAGEPVSYPAGFHTYALDWLEDQLRFYVDDVHTGTLYNDEVGEFLPRLTVPMQLVINTAIGGDFLPNPDESTVWPQRFLVDWVRVYDQSPEPAVHTFSNGDFEAEGGTLAGWHAFGNRVTDTPNVSAHREAVLDGKASLKLFGQFSGSANYSGVAQGISVRGGDEVRAKLSAHVRSADSIAGTDNSVTMKIEFYKRFGDFFGGPAMLGAKELVIADGRTPNDEWITHELAAEVPEGAVEARLAIVFTQPTNQPGAVQVDGVEFAVVDDQNAGAD
jgi:hypothetical protein